MKSHDELDIISLSETHLNDKNITDHLNIEGYSYVGRNRAKSAGREVTIYIKDGISFEHRNDLNHGSIENIYIEISIKNSKPLIFACFYRPPDSSKYLSKDFNEPINRKSKLCVK